MQLSGSSVQLMLHRNLSHAIHPIGDATSTHDAQVIDVATEIQQVEQAMPDSGADQESGEVEDDSDDVEMKEEEVKQRLNIAHIQEIARVFLGYFVMHYWL